MYHTIHTLDVFNLYLSIPNLSIALEKPNTLDETQLCFWHVTLEQEVAMNSTIQV